MDIEKNEVNARVITSGITIENNLKKILSKQELEFKNGDVRFSFNNCDDESLDLDLKIIMDNHDGKGRIEMTCWIDEHSIHYLSKAFKLALKMMEKRRLQIALN